MLLHLLLITLLYLVANPSWAEENKPVILKTIQTSIVVNNKKALVFNIIQENGTEGFIGVKGHEFNVILKNETKVPISIHWHGLILPNNQDGVAYVTQLPIPPGGSYHYHFPLVQAGTYWMHSHYKAYIQQLMEAPLIIQDPNDPYQGYKNIVVSLADFSFKNPEAIFADLKKQATKKMKKMPTQQDLNDVQYDAFLANRRTINDPDIINVTPGEKIRLRIINASAATNFWIHTGALKGTLIAVDGQAISPLQAPEFPLAIAQRADILVTIPKQNGTYPILAQVEGTKKQAGILLVTTATSAKIPAKLAAKNVGALNDQQEMLLHSLHPLPSKPVTKVLHYSLEGNMEKYIWMINNEVWPKIKPLTIKKGERVEMIFTNNTNMSHPMHFHGHTFQVTNIDGKVIDKGPLRDTILVLPHSTKTVIFDAENLGIWPMHCHVLYHQLAGMMTTINYQNYPPPAFYQLLINSKK